jgi:hypothetical protein
VRLHVPKVCNEIDPDRSAYEKSVAEIQYPADSGMGDVWHAKCLDAY